MENESSGGGQVLLWLALLAAVAIAVALYFNPGSRATTPAEPTDESTRVACRHWQVTLAASGVDRIDEVDRKELRVVLDDFLPRAEATAKTREASQTTFLAVVDAISEARKLRHAEGREVADQLPVFRESVAAVEETCSSA